MPSHFHMEKVLRAAGVAVRPYPTLKHASAAEDPSEADRQLIVAGTAWEHEIERLYTLHVQRQQAGEQPKFVQLFEAMCRSEGIDAALATVNATVPHRYTGVYRREAAEMVNLALVDKLREGRPTHLERVPHAASFCQYVLKDGSFLTGDSGGDNRLNGHPYQGVMLAYCGVPIFDAEGAPRGTLCHFDTAGHEPDESEILRLHAAASVLANYIA